MSRSLEAWQVDRNRRNGVDRNRRAVRNRRAKRSKGLMSQTDPIAELLTRIRNAMHARYNQVEVPHSRMREAICRTLSAEGFFGGVEVAGEIPKKKLVVGPALFGRARTGDPGNRTRQPPQPAPLRGSEFDAAGAARDGCAGGDDAARRDDRSRGAAQKGRRRSSAEDLVEGTGDVAHRQIAGGSGKRREGASSRATCSRSRAPRASSNSSCRRASAWR